MNNASNSIQDLEALIADGLVPPCPYCTSDLEIERSEGMSGAIAFRYSCSNQDCELTPGLARIPWHRVLLNALQLRAVQLSLAAIGSVTIAGLFGVWTGMISVDSAQNGANDSSGASLGGVDVSQISSGLNIVEGLTIPVFVWDKNDTIVEANSAACQFVLAPREALLGKTPAYLRARIANLIENPIEWMLEQNEREIQTYDGFLGRPTEVPMILKEGHPVYAGSWRIETIKHEIGGDIYWVTRYFRD